MNQAIKNKVSPKMKKRTQGKKKKKKKNKEELVGDGTSK